MKIQKLSLVFFKNHKQFQVEIESDLVSICGLNGVGKTTVLDAIHFLCLGKSYFSGTDVQCIQKEEIAAGILATLQTDELIDIKIKLKRGSRKTIERNGVVCKKVTDYIGEFVAVVIAPGDIELVYGANEKRRSFVNQIISQVDRNHLLALVNYNKLIEQRNKHLKQEVVDQDLLHTFDEQIAPLAHTIYQDRVAFLEELIPDFEKHYFEISGEKERVSLLYTSQLSSKTYMECVMENRQKDIAVQRSFSGIHKDELDIVIGGNSMKKMGSQGQIKSSLIALKLAEYNYLSQKKKTTPFLLLDDIFEKIDQERADVLTQIIKNGNFGQIFVTDTNTKRLAKFAKKIGKSHKAIILN